MEEEDVGGSKRGHDPHQPAHVTRPGTQLPQVQPGKAGLKNCKHCIYALPTRTLIHTHTHTHTHTEQASLFTMGRRRQQ